MRTPSFMLPVPSSSSPKTLASAYFLAAMEISFFFLFTPAK